MSEQPATATLAMADVIATMPIDCRWAIVQVLERNRDGEITFDQAMAELEQFIRERNKPEGVKP